MAYDYLSERGMTKEEWREERRAIYFCSTIVFIALIALVVHAYSICV